MNTLTRIFKCVFHLTDLILQTVSTSTIHAFLQILAENMKRFYEARYNISPKF